MQEGPRQAAVNENGSIAGARGADGEIIPTVAVEIQSSIHVPTKERIVHSARESEDHVVIEEEDDGPLKASAHVGVRGSDEQLVPSVVEEDISSGNDGVAEQVAWGSSPERVEIIHFEGSANPAAPEKVHFSSEGIRTHGADRQFQVPVAVIIQSSESGSEGFTGSIPEDFSFLDDHIVCGVVSVDGNLASPRENGAVKRRRDGEFHDSVGISRDGVPVLTEKDAGVAKHGPQSIPTHRVPLVESAAGFSRNQVEGPAVGVVDVSSKGGDEEIIESIAVEVAEACQGESELVAGGVTQELVVKNPVLREAGSEEEGGGCRNEEGMPHAGIWVVVQESILAPNPTPLEGLGRVF